MPNWCYSEYTIRGNEIFIQDLKNRVENTSSLEDLLTNFGFAPERFPYSYRGSVEYVELVSDDTLRIATETAWLPCDEVFMSILAKDYSKSLTMDRRSEEAGMGIFINSDEEDLLYRVSIQNDKVNESLWSSEPSEVIDFVNKHLPDVKGKTIQGIEKAFIELSTKKEDNDYYSIEMERLDPLEWEKVLPYRSWVKKILKLKRRKK